jgi:type I restriction enzyme, S subunit
MSAYRPYPSYKDSGVEWLGDVPEGWEVTKLKFTAAITPSNIDKKSYEDELPISLCNYTDVYYNETITPEIEFMAATASREQIRKFSLKQHDVIITKDSEDPNDIAVPSLVAETMDSVVCGYHLTMLRPTKSTDGRFLKRFFDSKTTRAYFSTRANGLTRYGLGSYPLSNADIALPPLSEQHQIAAFLDRECGKLDALQAKQERLIELLKEKRQALISHAVTRGLDPTAKLKPSGIEWLGDVPEHWAVKKLGLVGDFKGGAGFPDEHQGETENEIPFFKVGDIVNSDERGIMRQANHSITRNTARQLRAFIFPAGTIVFAKVGAALLLKRFRSLGQPSCIDNNMMGMAAGRDAQSGFLLYVLPRLDFSLFVNPGAVPSVNEGQISSQRIPLPPIAEQHAIVAHLDEKCGKIDQLKAKAERAIELLKERRSALISAAVTGKIDVRDS